ncbi:2-nonaprenyl-3-methyl-6-methoxy-1,4-benzoquinol hydroxylase [Tepidimonas aquatica]|uniref:3-demethoxyubiquinol 3-hydroxylase n=2 Tax=Tepidimonas aquatica TaxID=247482 RepID=A0A554WWA9_9BURK|nr:2-nonaprenyl-3-methyl-6-methoxy-1,4-benzoquinol hydroxylase [Tepidimonas aquatica]
MAAIMNSFVDATLIAADNALRTLLAPHRAARPTPQPPAELAAHPAALSDAEQRLSGALMRVNHVGEICAQALYTGQAYAARIAPGAAAADQERTTRHLEAAAQDETDHLAWCQQRLDELGDRRSLLCPLWYAGAFAIGVAAGLAGRGVSLGFVVETERQVEAHLDGHLDRLPAHDHASRAIVRQMKDDEIRHARDALHAGGVELPTPVKWAMRAAAKVMTTVAYRI